MAFALAIPVVVGAMGVSVDIARSYLVKERLSHALDAAALAGAGSANLEGDELQARIENFFYRNFGESGNIEIVITQTSSNLSVSAVVPLDTTFMQVLGVSSVDISNNVVVQREVRGLEVVMVLDVTGSMATNDNIGALRTAATNFTHIICPGTTCVNNVRIGLGAHPVTGCMTPRL